MHAQEAKETKTIDPTGIFLHSNAVTPTISIIIIIVLLLILSFLINTGVQLILSPSIELLLRSNPVCDSQVLQYILRRRTIREHISFVVSLSDVGLAQDFNEKVFGLP